MKVLRLLWNYRSTLILVLIPLLLLPLPVIAKSTEASCGFCIILMTIYWIAESLPLAVTAFLPLVLFPLMGIMSASEVSLMYLKDTNWLCTGGLIIAIAVEHTRLHKRIALRILLSIGTNPQALMLGFMIPTYVLSMWTTNTATTAMMLPIADAIIKELLKDHNDGDDKENMDGNDEKNGEPENHSKSSSTNDEILGPISIGNELEVKGETFDSIITEEGNAQANILETDSSLEKKKRDMAKGLTLCVPYASSIGGFSTLTGTAPNLILAGQYEMLFPYADVPLTFGIWFIYHFPLSLTIFLFAYLWLMWFYLGFNLKGLCRQTKQNITDIRITDLLRSEYNSLGSIRWDEVTVLIVFATTALLWFFREPGFMPGWGMIFKDDYVSDGTVAMTMAALLFILPSKRPDFLHIGAKNPNDFKLTSPVLDWPTVHRMFPWNIMFLLGGGFALAGGATASGFSMWLADQLTALEYLDDWVICLIITVILSLFTECTSNIAATSLFIPIVAQLAQSLEIHPLYLLQPMTVATSLAFMLPVATPSNAIAFSYGRLEVSDLVKAGWLLNIIGVIALMLFINTYGKSLFGLETYPDWAAVNYTTPQPSSIHLNRSISEFSCS